MEFMIVTPVLVLILLGGFNFGLGAYQAHMASDAAQMPSTHKLTLSNTLTAVTAATLQGYMNDDGLKGSIRSGAFIDNVTLKTAEPHTRIMIGSKIFKPGAPFLPGFTITVGQAINANLLEAAQSGAEVRPYKTPWVPGETPVAPPW